MFAGPQKLFRCKLSLFWAVAASMDCPSMVIFRCAVCVHWSRFIIFSHCTKHRMSSDETCSPPASPKRGQTRLRQGLLMLSESEHWDCARHEWQLLGCHWNDTEDRCLCRHPIKERCVIENIHTSQQAIVGNCCVRQFLGHLAANTGAVFASIKRVRNDNTKSLHVDMVDNAEAQHAITTSAADLYKKLIRKRVLSCKQSQFRQRMNQQILNHAAGLANDGSSPWPLDVATLTSALGHAVVSKWEHSFYSSNLGKQHVTDKQQPIKQRIEANIEAWTRTQGIAPTAC